MKTVYLIRHGETEWNIIRKMQGQLDSPLTAFGVKQGKWIQERMDQIAYDVILTSPLGRAHTTAKMINQNKQKELVLVDELKEIHLGPWEGRKKADIQMEHKEADYFFWNEPEKYVPLGGEDFFDMRKRAKKFVEEILLQRPEEKIAVVSHAITLKAIIAYMNGVEVKDMWKGNHLRPTSLTKVQHKNQGFHMEYIGDISHYKEESAFNGWFK